MRKKILTILLLLCLIAGDELSLISISSDNTKTCLEFSSSCYNQIKLIVKDEFECVSYMNYSTTELNCIHVSFPVNEECIESYRLEIEAYNITIYGQPSLNIPG